MRKLLVILLCVWLAGCVHTEVTSQRFSGAGVSTAPYKSLFVWVAGASLQHAREVENAFAKEVQSQGIVVYPGSSYARIDAKAQEIADKVIGSGADGFLLIIGLSAGYNKSYVPPSYTPGTTTTNVQDLGDRIQVTTTTTPGYVSGGYNLYFPHGSFIAHLYDARLNSGNKEVWYAQIASNGSADSTINQLYEDVGKETAKKLRADAVLAPPAK